MSIRKIKSRKFKLKKQAVEWAKTEKKRAGLNSGLKWETNRVETEGTPWEAVLFKEVS